MSCTLSNAALYIPCRKKRLYAERFVVPGYVHRNVYQSVYTSDIDAHRRLAFIHMIAISVTSVGTRDPHDVHLNWSLLLSTSSIESA